MHAAFFGLHKVSVLLCFLHKHSTVGKICSMPAAFWSLSTKCYRSPPKTHTIVIGLTGVLLAVQHMQDPAFHPLALEIGLAVLAAVLGGLLLTPMIRIMRSFVSALDVPDWAQHQLRFPPWLSFTLHLNLVLPALGMIVWVCLRCSLACLQPAILLSTRFTFCHTHHCNHALCNCQICSKLCHSAWTSETAQTIAMIRNIVLYIYADGAPVAAYTACGNPVSGGHDCDSSTEAQALLAAIQTENLPC